MEGVGGGTQWGGRFDRWRYRLQNTPYFCVFKYARAVKQKVWNEAENRERDWGDTLKYDWHARRVRLSRIARVRFSSHVLPISLLILRKTPTVLQSSDGKFFHPSLDRLHEVIVLGIWNFGRIFINLRLALLFTKMTLKPENNYLNFGQ